MDQISQLLHSVGNEVGEDESAGQASAYLPRHLQQGDSGGHVQLSAQATRGGSGTRDEMVVEDTVINSGPSMEKIAQLRLALICTLSNTKLTVSYISYI